MTEAFLDDLGVLPSGHEKRGVTVAEVVEPDVRQFGFLQKGFDIAASHVLAVEQPSELVRKDQPLVVVKLTDLQLPLHLGDAMAL